MARKPDESDEWYHEDCLPSNRSLVFWIRSPGQIVDGVQPSRLKAGHMRTTTDLLTFLQVGDFIREA